jgi:hypothetical protein
MGAFHFLLFIANLFLAYSDPPLLPRLPWTTRSDWLNVKSLGARGDGVNDDTAAIQDGFNALQFTANTTLYFPPGTYLVSSTVVLNRTTGRAVIGNGRDSVWLWTGGPPRPANATVSVWWSDGNTRFLVEGLIMDGGGMASFGLDHMSRTLYESRFVHRNMLWRNFNGAGVRVGYDNYSPGGVASAEMPFVNCM